jgi:hypothetical protein
MTEGLVIAKLPVAGSDKPHLPCLALNALVAHYLLLQQRCSSFTATLLYFQPPCLHFSPSLFLSCSSPAYPLCSSLSAHLWSRLAFSTCQLADRPVFTPKLGHSKLHRAPQSALAWFHIRRWTTQLRCGLSIPSRLRSGSRPLHHLHHRPH